MPSTIDSSGLPSKTSFLALRTGGTSDHGSSARRTKKNSPPSCPVLWMIQSRGYRFHGCSNLAAFAREWLGMSPRRAQALLRVERASGICPTLGEAYRTGRLTGVQAHGLIPILVLRHADPWRAAWVAHAEAVSLRRLEEDVKRAS